VEEPALTAINMRLRDDYTNDCQRGLDRWNKIIEKTGVAFRLELPHVAFHRQIGEFQGIKASPAGQILDDVAWNRDKARWLPSIEDGDFIQSLMKPVLEPGQFASWIAPPRIGIDNKPGDFEYVKIAA
jgi:benzoyl-CoA 2,3-dioxygenase component B